MRYLIFLFLSINLFASTLHLATSANPSRLNPILATDSSSSEITGFLFNGLLKYDKDLSTIVGDLAEKFYFEDEKTLVFKLHKNIKWHDGKKFSAKDVLFTYNVLISPKISSPYSANFRFVQGVEIVDEFTLKVRYKEPYFKALETWMMGILPEHILKEEPNLMNSKFNTNPIGTGAYKLEQLEYSKNIILVAFDDYFEGRAKIDKISFHVIADPMTRFLMLKSGALDVGNIEPMQYERQLNDDFFKKFNIYENISQSYTYLGFNLRLEKFKNPKVREALSLAINRQELVDILFFNHAKVCSGPFLPGTKAFNEDVKAPLQNIKRAKELLKEAGYDEKNPFTFEIATSNSSELRPYAAQILQHQLKKAGVVVTLRVMEWQAFLNMVVFPRKFDSVLLGWGLSPTPDPYMFWHSDSDKQGGFNLVGYHNPKINKMIEESQNMIDSEKLNASWGEMFKIITDENPYLFLYIPNSITTVNRDIKNIESAPIGIWHNYIKWEK
ncbi:MAG: peptide ABC transporter substrate-binding protein [Sulfurimonas sp. RIFCSPHIGHO2_12_FULL_36_9]|uniref:peptide-binding protein n=1 Tax=Sulfurimonas sp. RIFCSPLOWO2_12_36_12 TaxID=1802253 RepID=UPI0008C92984|nr:peptide-binding protein [Sulfurimonas sp. RIFCSPLOWO2_12_36_12]OHD96326.1 MAG: peptide ABC transporter substrate-binding protein [Sulfurimonas sp. RIFCSPHIGHO2_12_FULL_36_9]OHD97080.1 MAG: peptide ABC transporter substrate-binding protein [Sulfurimonas sp. RIFCSPLOWO2_02_FULL_36_28]OHE00250.1 MAG: peptide ABC transporter substrate-binding protein [Sulfurimonas sp. RIFCSPLOWO2_12_36_12]OHE07973.1 MAG: peptide ABC transporter substrate-binding protein [Sulfurimonas sp. RIFCSPLOWO2_12_FULL_36_7